MEVISSAAVSNMDVILFLFFFEIGIKLEEKFSFFDCYLIEFRIV